MTASIKFRALQTLREIRAYAYFGGKFAGKIVPMLGSGLK